MRILVFGLLLLSSAAASAAPGHLCWTDKVQIFGDELRIFPTPDYVPRIIIKRNGTGKAERYELASSDKYFVLHEGDIAYLNGGPHDTCTLTVASRASGLGVLFEAASRPHGLPPDLQTEFVLATKQADDSR